MNELNDAFDALVADLGGTVVDQISDDDLMFAEPLVGPGLRSPELTGFDKGEILNLISMAAERARVIGYTPTTR